MPPYKRHQLDEQRDAAWIENESTLRCLYLKERKTLKDVKRAMESEHGFPATPLSTYESKLRDLGLRKKMKSKDWRPVYQHYINSGSRHTAIYFNETRIPWNRAWKEIRRSGARELNGGETIELPTDVIMRTPSPVAPQSVFTLHGGRGPTPAPWHLSNEPLDGLTLDAVFRRLTLYDIPSNLLRIELLSTLEQPPTNSHMESDEFSYNRRSLPNSTNERADYYTLLHKSTLAFCQGSKHGNLTSDIDRLSSALYQLANSDVLLLSSNGESIMKSFNEALDVVLNLAPKHILSNILEGDSPTIRAVTERLPKILMQLEREDDLRVFMEAIGRYHPEWIPQGQYLVSAGRIGCIKTCRLLLRMPNRPQYDPSCDRYIKDYTRAVLESTARGHVECAKILCRHMIKPGTNLPSPENTLASKVFDAFILNYAYKKHFPAFRTAIFDYNLSNPGALQILNWFLEADANVDAPASSQSLEHHIYTRHTPKWWMPTILDEVYSKNFKLYSHIVGYSVKFRTELTRSGVHRSAKEGIDSLRMYLRSRPSYTPIQQAKLLGIILTEVLLGSHICFGPDRKDRHEQNAKVTHTLLNYNIDLPQFGSSMNVSAMLFHIVRETRRHGIIYPTTHYILKALTCTGAAIVAETIAEAIEAEGITLLQLLSSYGVNFKGQGASALCAAINLGNYEAVNWLLNIGVDINATLKSYGKEEGVTILARANGSMVRHNAFEFDILDYHVHLDSLEENRPISCGMLEYLICRNIKLRASPNNTNIRQLLYLIIVHGIRYKEWTETIKKTQLLLNTESITDDPSDTEPCLLAACFTYSPEHIAVMLDLMEPLLDYGISFKRSGVLAALILLGAPIDTIQRALDRGADVNAYLSQGTGIKSTPLQAAVIVGSLDLVQLLIKRGADVNQPGEGFEGTTALQIACRLSRQVGIDLIRFLITNGADVNAPPVPYGGKTAFQAAAMDGNFEVALLLLDHGADVNASPSTSYGYCALDGAACYGRLDMVQFLLELGALSHDKGESGYKGAIRNAGREQHLATVDIIRQHALKNGRAGEELSPHYTQWQDSYPREDSDDFGDASGGSEIGLEDQDYWEGLQPV
ncbi:hypothetical protein F4782DRAFT_511573 [Xylaria castorea]|nr:hypothetical protein F4782DRAFT_511573 [Xylaria castorea]